jgi:hypothetical protein
MATIKFSEFDQGNINAVGAVLVGLESGVNKKFTASDLKNGLATQVYVDGEITTLQNQITANTSNISGNSGNITTLQGQVTALEGNVAIAQGNIVVLENRVTALENNVSVNQNDIVTLQGNVVSIENQLANIADTDSQTLSWDGATANLSISNSNNVVLQEVLDNAGNITIMQGQISDLQANGNIQLLSLDNTSNVLSISAGNSVDFTTILANVIGSDAQTLSWDSGNSILSISGGNSVTIDNNAAGSNTQVQYNSSGTLAGDSGLVYDDTGGKTLKVGVGGGTLHVNNIDGYDSVGNGLMLRSDNGAGVKASHILMRSHVSGTETIFLQGNVDFTSADGVDFTGTNVTGLPTNVTVTAYAETGWAGNIIPSANVTYNLGSDSARWNDLFLSGNTIHLGNQTISSTDSGLTVNVDNLYGNSNVVTMGASFIPDTNAQYDLGSAEYKIRHLFLSDNSLHVGNSTITTGTNNTIILSNSVANNVDSPAPGTLSLETSIHVLSSGTYILPDGQEGQSISLVPADGAEKNLIVVEATLRTFEDPSPAATSPGKQILPFNSVSATDGSTLVQLVFAAGAWNFSKAS